MANNRNFRTTHGHLNLLAMEEKMIGATGKMTYTRVLVHKKKKKMNPHKSIFVVGRIVDRRVDHLAHRPGTFLLWPSLAFHLYLAQVASHCIL